MLRSVYEQMLKLYPDSYQKKYGAAMIQTMKDVVSHEPNRIMRQAIYAKEILTTPMNALEQYVILFAKNRHITPKTVVSLVALLLLSPFFIAVIADEVTEFMTGGHLYNTWLWSQPVLLIWIGVLPFISLVIALCVYLLSMARSIAKKEKTRPLAKKYWLTIVTALLAFGILFLLVFHDSVHCWLGSTPAKDIVTCTESGILGGDSH